MTTGSAVPPTTALADVLALLGRRGYVDRSRLNPVAVPAAPVAGRARTVRIEAGPGTFSLLYDLLSDPLDGAVVVVAAAGVEGAVWGEILSIAAAQSGAVGAVIDGCVRDHAAVAATGLCVWGGPAQTVGPAGRAHIAAIDEPVTIAGTTVNAGDLVVLDGDGIVVGADDAVVAHACAYAEAEDAVVAALAGGRPLREAYRHKADAVRQITEAGVTP